MRVRNGENAYREYLKHHNQEINWIYHSLADEKSKEIYKNLLLLQYTEEEKYLIEAIRLNDLKPDDALVQKEELLNESITGNRKLVLYGIGQIAWEGFQLAESKRNAMGYLYVPFITDIPWTAYCDKNLAGAMVTVEGKEYYILSPAELYEKYSDALVCVTSQEFFEEIKEELINLGIQEKNILLYHHREQKCLKRNSILIHRLCCRRKKHIL